MGKGLFITFEGIDGAGKTTQFRIAEEYLNKNGFDVLAVREPGGTNIGEKIREILLDKGNTELSYRAEGLLYAASRAQLVDQIIRPHIQKGGIVLCDRYIDSSVVYQGIGRNLGVDEIYLINRFATGGLMPDLTILIDITPKVRELRIRNQEQDRLEMENDTFHYKVREGYLRLAEKSPRIKIVDGNRNRREISSEIKEIILKLIHEREVTG